jgi:hypothetical protein
LTFIINPLKSSLLFGEPPLFSPLFFFKNAFCSSFVGPFGFSCVDSSFESFGGSSFESFGGSCVGSFGGSCVGSFGGYFGGSFGGSCVGSFDDSSVVNNFIAEFTSDSGGLYVNSLKFNIFFNIIKSSFNKFKSFTVSAKTLSSFVLLKYSFVLLKEFIRLS